MCLWGKSFWSVGCGRRVVAAELGCAHRLNARNRVAREQRAYTMLIYLSISVIIVLVVIERRTMTKTKWLGGYIGVPYPINFLENRRCVGG